MKRLTVALLIGTALLVASCGANTNKEAAAPAAEETKTETATEEVKEEAPAETEETKEEAKEEAPAEEKAEESKEITKLPEYGDVEEDAFLRAVSKKIVESNKDMFPEAGVSIPVYIPIEQNFDNPDDITAWGWFEVWNYDLDGTTLVNSSGGTNAGLMHLKETDAGYEVTSYEPTYDDDSLKELCKANNFDATKFTKDDETDKLYREISLCNYVNGYDLPIDSYQDAGMDKVMLHTNRENLKKLSYYIWSGVYGGGVDISSNSVIKGSDMNVDALDITTGVCASDDPYFLVAVEAGNGVYKLTPDGVFSFISATLAAGDSAADKAMQLREQDEEGLLVYNSGDWGEAVPFTEVEKVDIDRDGNAVVTGTLGTKGLDEMSRGFTIKYTKSPDCPFGYTFEELELK